MADNISSLYEIACAKGVLDPNTKSEEWFRKQISTEDGLRSFYDYATSHGMRIRPYDEFKQKLSQPIAETTLPTQQQTAAEPAIQGTVAATTNPTVKDHPAPTTEQEYQANLAVQNEDATPLPTDVSTQEKSEEKKGKSSFWQSIGAHNPYEYQTQQYLRASAKQEQERQEAEAKRKEAAEQIEKRRPLFEEHWNGKEGKEGDAARLDRVLQAATEKANEAQKQVADEYGNAYRFTGMPGGTRLAMRMEEKRAYNKEASPDVVMDAFTKSLDEDYQAALAALNKQTGGKTDSAVSRPMTNEELAAMYQQAGIMSPEDYEWYRQYVQDKMQEKFAAMDVPKNKMDYFVNKFMQSNLIGQLATLYTDTPYQRASKAQGVETYENEHDDFGTKAVGFGADVAGLLADPTMLIMPMAGSALGGAAVRNVAGQALKSVGYASAEDIAARAMAQRGILRTANRLAGSAFTFAGIDAAHDVVNQLYAPIYNEETGKYEDGNWQPWQTAKAAAKGAITGTIFGGAGLLGDHVQHVVGEAWNKAAGVVAGKATHFVGGTNAMVGTSVVSQILQGKKASDINWGEEYAHAAAMQLVFDLQGGVRNLEKVRRDAAVHGKSLSLPQTFVANWQRMKADPYAGSFTREEIEQFNKAGYEGKDGYEILLNLNGGKEYKNLNELYSVLERVSQDPTIDTQAKYRLASLVYGKVEDNVRPVMTDLFQDEQGRYIVRTYDTAGQNYETRQFTSEQRAKDFAAERRIETQTNLKQWAEGIVRNATFAQDMQRIADEAVIEIQKQFPQYTAEQIYEVMREALLNPHAGNGKALSQDGDRAAIRSMFENYLSTHRPTNSDMLGAIMQNVADRFGITADEVRQVTRGGYKELGLRERGIYDDYVSRLVNAMPKAKAQAEAEQQQSARQQAEAVVAPLTNQTDGKMYAVVRADDETRSGHIIRGKIEIDTTNPNHPIITNTDVVTVRYADGSVEQLPARDLNLAGAPAAAAEVVEQHTAEQVAAEQTKQQLTATFHAGQEVAMTDAEGNTHTSRVVSVSDEGVEVEITDAEGKPNTTIIPAATALTSLQPVAEQQPPTQEVNTQVAEKDTQQPAVPNIDTMSSDELGAATVEYMGGTTAAAAYLEAERDKAKKEVSRLIKQKITKFTDIADFKAQNDALQAQKKAATDRLNKLEQALIVASHYKTQAEQEAEAARKAEEQAKRAARRQTTAAATANTAPAERWQAAPKAEGNTVTRTLPDGTTIQGRYVLTEAGAATPSHDPNNGWNTSNGYPTTEDGRNINDRDYRNDRDAQQLTQQMAQTYDGQAVSQVPVVSSEGIVYDGNGRTIAGNIAAANNTDAAYIQALAANAANFGFTPEQVASMQHPRVYMQLDEDLPYNTTTLAKFNAQEKKTQSNTNRAVSNGKKITEAARDGILAILDNYGSLDAFFASEAGANDIVKSLLSNGIITQQEVAGLTEKTDRGFVFSPAGKDYVTDLLIGSLFDEQTIRLLGNDKGLKQSILRALPSIVENRRLGNYALTNDINGAIRLLYEARQAGQAYSLYIRQVDAFEGKVSDRYTPFEMLLAEEMSSGVDTFRQVLTLYNTSARDEANGQAGLFEPRTVEDIKNEILQHYANRQSTAAVEPTAGTAASRPQNPQTQSSVPSPQAGNGRAAAPAADIPASDTLKQIEAEAVPFEEIELTPANWYALFGEDGIVSTPIGDVKMGEHQYLKLAQKGRDGKLGMIKPTLEHPSVVVMDKSQAKDGQTTEREYSYVFIKAFVGKNGERLYYFTSITVSKDGREVVISNQEKDRSRIQRLLKNGKLAYINKATLPPASDKTIQGDQLTNPVGEEFSSADKGTTIVPNNQTTEQKSAEKAQPTDLNAPVEHSLGTPYELLTNSLGTPKRGTIENTQPQEQATETREQQLQRLEQERRESILQNGTGFDSAFGLVAPKDITSPQQITDNIEAIVRALALAEDALGKKGEMGSEDLTHPLHNFNGWVYGEGHIANAQHQIEGYLMRLDVLPSAITSEWAKQTGIKTRDDWRKYVEQLYKDTTNALRDLTTPLTLEQKQALVRDISDDKTKVVLVTNKTLTKTLAELGATRQTIADVVSALAKGDRINGFCTNGTVILNTDALHIGMDVIQTFVHERQHLFTKSNPQLLDTMVTHLSADRLAQLLQDISQTSFYDRYNNGTEAGHRVLADEFLSHIMQEAYATDKDADAVAQQYGITNQDILTSLHNLDYEQRNSNHLSRARRNTLLGNRTQNSSRQSGRDSQTGQKRYGLRTAEQGRGRTPARGQTPQDGEVADIPLFSASPSKDLQQSAKSTTFAAKTRVPKAELAVAYADMFRRQAQGQFPDGNGYAYSANYYHSFENGQIVQSVFIDGNENLISKLKQKYGIDSSTRPTDTNVERPRGTHRPSHSDDGLFQRQRGGDERVDSLHRAERTDGAPDNQEIGRDTQSDNSTGVTDPRFSVSGTQVVPLGEHTLVGLHNITSDKLRKVLRAGGLANPSAAVIDIARQDHHGYGEISLVMPSSLVDSRTGRNAGTYAGDAYTPMYPNVEYRAGKDTAKRIKDLVKSLPEPMQKRIAQDIVYYMEGNARNSGLQYLFLKERGQELPIEHAARRYPNIRLGEIYDRLGFKQSADGMDSNALYLAYEKLPADRLFEFNLWLTRKGDTTKMSNWKNRVDTYRKEGNNEWADRLSERLNTPLSFSEFDTNISEVSRDEREAGEERPEQTIEKAAQIINEQGLQKEFEQWQQDVIDQLGYEEVLYAGITKSGNRRYVPNTVENASRLMNSRESTNWLGGEGISETKSTLLDKFDTLAQIRQHKDILESDGDKILEAYKKVSDDWHQLGSDFYDYTLTDKGAFGLGDNPLIAIDTALARLQEAMLKRNPIAYLNREYRYSLSEDSEFGKRLLDIKERIQNLPSKYFETKFARPVYLNEFRNAVVPNDLPQDLRDGLTQAGLDLYEYDREQENSRREATLQATEDDGIRFSISYFPATDRTLSPAARQEMATIRDEAVANGTFMKAPNGESTRLTERQWLQVRTKAFKKWFGDWEKSARIEKLRKSKAIENHYNGDYELNRNSAKQWMLDNIRGEYTNQDTGETITISKVGINEVTSHGSTAVEHLKSLHSIPDMIENAIFIDEISNTKENDKYDSYRYYVCGLKIDGVDYTAKIVVGVKDGSKYYDHRLTEIEKGALLDHLNGLSNSVAENQNTSFAGKDTKLISILQTNSSKVVDENGEPLVVYHGARTGKQFYSFENVNNFFIDNKQVAQMFADEYAYQMIVDGEVYILSKQDAEEIASSIEPAYPNDILELFDQGVDNILDDITTIENLNDLVDYGGIQIGVDDFANAKEISIKPTPNPLFEVFLNMRNPQTIDFEGRVWEVGDDALLTPRLPHDGVIAKNIIEGGAAAEIDGQEPPVATDYVVNAPSQIKSATDNNGSFDESNDDIRFSISSSATGATPHMTQSEIATKTLVQNAQNDYNTMQSAIKKVGSDIRGIRKAMRLQSEYDRNVVSSLLNLYSTLMQANSVWAGYMPDTSHRVASQIVYAIGKEDISKEVNTIFDYIVDAQVKAAQRQWDKLRNTPIEKLNISGVVAQGKVALQGQHALKALNEALDNNLTTEQLENMIGEAMSNEMSATDESLRTQFKGRWIGYTIAQQHIERIAPLKQERIQLQNELDAARNNMSLKPAARRQLVGSIKEAMRDNYLGQSEAYAQSLKDLQEYVDGQAVEAKGFIAKQNANREKIRDYAAKDLEGIATNPHRPRTKRDIARSIWDAFASPMRDLQSMLRLCGRNTPDGEGYLYNHFMRNWIDGADREQAGLTEASRTLDNKMSELTHGKYKTWEEAARKINDKSHNKFSIKILNGVDGAGNPVEEEIPLNAGNALYIYAVNKMEDGRMKLSAMNITEEDVEKLVQEVREAFGQEILDVVDWIQTEYFSQLRNRYNPIHEDLFGAPMDAIENYFPLRINPNARQKNEDLGSPDTDASRLLRGTSTGAIKRRTRNSLPLDVRNADFFTEVVRHIAQMERWSAFAQLTRDANILFSDIDFRNRIKGMNGTIYGKGDQLYNHMKDAFKVALGTYQSKTDPFSEFALNMAKGVTSAKINFRIFTALKQLASFPAFFTYMTDGVFVKSYLRNWIKPHETMQWARTTLPNFDKRIRKRDMGDMRLMQRTTDWQWNKRLLELSSKYGMAANVFFDVLTCATGARAVYDSKYADYINKGYTEEEAAKRARQDAEVSFNTSQQSSEGAFMAPVQVDRNLFTAALTVFRTSNFQYTRNFFYAVRTLLNNRGKKDEMTASRAKQYIADGLTEEQARKAAETDWRKANISATIGIVVYGALLNLLWRLVGNAPYYLFGKDNEKKKELAKDAVTGGMLFSPFDGLIGGGIVESALDGHANVVDMFAPELPFTQDAKKAEQYLQNDKYAEFASQALSVLMQSGAGFDPMTAADIITRVATTIDSEQDLDTSVQFMRVSQALLSIPQSQYEQMLIDEVINNRKDYRHAVEDYKRYMAVHTAPLTWFLRGNENAGKVEKNAEKRFKKLYNERKELRN